MTKSNQITQEEDEAFEELEKKLQQKEETAKYGNLFPKDYVMPVHRNDVLEEVAQEIERFTFAFGVDTVQSFSAFVRSMKS